MVWLWDLPAERWGDLCYGYVPAMEFKGVRVNVAATMTKTASGYGDVRWPERTDQPLHLCPAKRYLAHPADRRPDNARRTRHRERPLL